MVLPGPDDSSAPSAVLTSDEATTTDTSIELQDPLDFKAAIIYIVIDAILAVGPLTVYFAYMKPVFDTWTNNDNLYFRVVQKFVWIGNLAIYAMPALVGGFTWFWNAYVTAGYLAWTQYLVLWGGSAF